jgi:putative tricarboxylic transport membrane protein
MQFSDRVTGLAVAALGVATVVGAVRLPPMPGQPIGPSAFPILIGAALCICGVLVALGVGRSFEAPEAGLTDAPSSNQPVAEWRVFIPVALLIFFLLTVNTVGFVPVTALVVLIMAWQLGAKWRSTLLLAAVTPPLIHLIFARLLRVPLASGWLPMPW